MFIRFDVAAADPHSLTVAGAAQASEIGIEADPDFLLFPV